MPRPATWPRPRCPDPRTPGAPPPAHPRAVHVPLRRASATTQRSNPRGRTARDSTARAGQCFVERAQNCSTPTRRYTTRNECAHARRHAEPEPAEGAERAHTHTVPTHRQLFSIKAVYVPLTLALPNIRQATEPAPRLELEGEPEHLVVPRIEQRPHPKHAVVLCRDVLERQKVCLCAILPSQASD